MTPAASPAAASQRSAPVEALDDPVGFSLFQDDNLRSVYSALGLGPRLRFRLVWRCVVLVIVTYVPMAALALMQGLADTAVSPTNFFADFAAYAQFLIALPLYVVAESIIDGSTRDAAAQFLGNGIVQREDTAKVHAIHATVERLRKSRWLDLLCIAIAYFFSLVILVPQFGDDPLPTWHVQGDEAPRLMTAAGVWAFFIAIPLLNYLWLRLIAKIVLWIYYLYRITRIHLDLHPTHADGTGGIGFISETQGRFALFILAYGIGNVAAPVGYQIAVLNYDLTILPVWGPLVLFSLGAPALFTLPLFMFTKQLFRSKRKALAAYRERMTAQSLLAERHWRLGTSSLASPEEIRQLSDLETLGSTFSRVARMRVVPFDLRSFGQLVGSTLGAIATLLPLLYREGELAAILDAIGRLVGHASGN